MTYILSFTVPVVYDADDDDHARLIAEHVEDTLLGASLPHAAELLEPSYILEYARHVDADNDDDRTVLASDDMETRYAPFPADTGAGHEPCPACLDYIRASRTPATGDVGLTVETVEDDQPGQVRHP